MAFDTAEMRSVAFLSRTPNSVRLNLTIVAAEAPRLLQFGLAIRSSEQSLVCGVGTDDRDGSPLLRGMENHARAADRVEIIGRRTPQAVDRLRSGGRELGPGRAIIG